MSPLIFVVIVPWPIDLTINNMAKNNPAKRQKSDSSARSVFVYTGAGCSVPKDVVRVKFDPSVVEVANCAFENCCTRLREVVLNNGLQKIGKYAFYNCKSLERHFGIARI